MIGKQNGRRSPATDYADHQSNAHEKSRGKRHGSLPSELERVAILKVLGAKAEQQQQQQATAKADQQKTQANQHSTTDDDDLLRQLQTLQDEGASASDAARQLAQTTGLSRRKLYALLHQGASN